MIVITVRWQLADIVPVITHHFNGNGSIAYGTKITNKIYHTRYSLSAKPTPSPTNPLLKNYKLNYLVIILNCLKTIKSRYLGC